MNQKERLEAIREKHTEEQKRRRILTHRFIAVAAGAVILLVIVFGVKGCVSTVSKRKAESTVPTASPTVAATVLPNVISDSYYSNCAFVGNSFIDGMSVYGLLKNTDYFSKVGLNVNSARSETVSGGKVPVAEELKNDKKYSKIFMMFGENELGWTSTDSFIEQYGQLIDIVRSYQPDAKLYLLAITPVTKKVSDENIDNTNNERILQYNELIRKLAADKNAVFADIYSAVADSEGNLPEGAASDGVHFGKDYYEKCLLYIQNNI